VKGKEEVRYEVGLGGGGRESPGSSTILTLVIATFDLDIYLYVGSINVHVIMYRYSGWLILYILFCSLFTTEDGSLDCHCTDSLSSALLGSVSKKKRIQIPRR
jgi:hypothetical protein